MAPPKLRRQTRFGAAQHSERDRQRGRARAAAMLGGPQQDALHYGHHLGNVPVAHRCTTQHTERVSVTCIIFLLPRESFHAASTLVLSVSLV